MFQKAVVPLPTLIVKEQVHLEHKLTKQLPLGLLKAPDVKTERYTTNYSQFVTKLKNDEIVSLQLSRSSVKFFDTEKNIGSANIIINDSLLQLLDEKDVDVYVNKSESNLSGLVSFIPIVMFSILLFSMMGKGMMPKVNNKTTEMVTSDITFEDVAGINDSIHELYEIVDFLKYPSKYTSVGALVPKGCLLTGPPGVGKTLLAKAIAGEAEVPFFASSASEFVEMFVGVGALRVRGLFEEAKKNAPCIIFIDEIDAIGKARNNGAVGGNDEREQTLNQLLTELDGFNGREGVIIIGATNREDVLDPALLRPGRFDRKISINLPNCKERMSILEVHSRGKMFGKSVDFQEIAKQTIGFSGADLASLLNEAAILSVRNDSISIEQHYIQESIERVLIGSAQSRRIVSNKEKRIVAYHEAGHAIASLTCEGYDTLTKVTIVPRGKTGGVTIFTPHEDHNDSGLFTKAYLKNSIIVALGGHVAEEIIFGEENVTTGASSDFMRATEIAREMVCVFGMSGLGKLSGDKFQGDKFRDTADKEIDLIIKECYSKCYSRLETRKDILHIVALELMERETLDGSDVKSLMLN